jgi:hypothetical protein
MGPLNETAGSETTGAIVDSTRLMVLALLDTPRQEVSVMMGGWECSLTEAWTAVVEKMVVTLMWSLVLEIARGAP